MGSHQQHLCAWEGSGALFVAGVVGANLLRVWRAPWHHAGASSAGGVEECDTWRFARAIVRVTLLSADARASTAQLQVDCASSSSGEPIVLDAAHGACAALKHPRLRPLWCGRPCAPRAAEPPQVACRHFTTPAGPLSGDAAPRRAATQGDSHFRRRSPSPLSADETVRWPASGRPHCCNDARRSLTARSACGAPPTRAASAHAERAASPHTCRADRDGPPSRRRHRALPAA